MIRHIGPPVFLLLILPAGLALAAEPERPDGSGPRSWTSRDGKHTTQATMIGYKSGKVRLRKADGATVEVALVDLSEEDGDFVREHAADDPEAIDALTRQKVELERNDEGRVVQATFPAGSHVSRRDIELLSSLPSLQRLFLAQTRPIEGAFVDIQHLQGLEQLDLTATPIGNPEVKPLADLKRLKSLSLSDTRITNRALSYLTELPKLSELALANTRIGDEGIANLEEIKTLKKLNLGNVLISPQGFLRLREALPNTAVEGSGVIRRR